MQQLDNYTLVAYSSGMEIVEAKGFSQNLKFYLADDEYRKLQKYLSENPEAGDVVSGTGGLRKVRWSEAKRSKGKRGGVRILYCHFPEDEQLYLLTLYDKDTADDLTPAQKKHLKDLLTQEKHARQHTREKRKR